MMLSALLMLGVYSSIARMDPSGFKQANLAALVTCFVNGATQDQTDGNDTHTKKHASRASISLMRQRK